MTSETVTIHELAKERHTRQGDGQGPKSSPPSTKSPTASSSEAGHTYNRNCSSNSSMQVNGNVGSDKGMANHYNDQQAQGESTQVNGNMGDDVFTNVMAKR